MHERLQRRLRLRDGHARLQPPKRVHPAAPTIGEHFHRYDKDWLLHHDRNKDFRVVAEFHAVKTLLHDTDHRHAVAVHKQILTYNFGITTEPLLPIVVCQHHQRTPVGNAVILWRERAT